MPDLIQGDSDTRLLAGSTAQRLTESAGQLALPHRMAHVLAIPLHERRPLGGANLNGATLKSAHLMSAILAGADLLQTTCPSGTVTNTVC